MHENRYLLINDCMYIIKILPTDYVHDTILYINILFSFLCINFLFFHLPMLLLFILILHDRKEEKRKNSEIKVRTSNDNKKD